MKFPLASVIMVIFLASAKCEQNFLSIEGIFLTNKVSLRQLIAPIKQTDIAINKFMEKFPEDWSCDVRSVNDPRKWVSACIKKSSLEDLKQVFRIENIQNEQQVVM